MQLCEHDDDHIADDRDERKPLEPLRRESADAFRRGNMPRAQVVERDREEGRDGHRPGQHAPRAEHVEHVDALGDEPDDEDERPRDADVEADPEPASELRPGEHGDADRDDHRPRHHADERIREPEHRALPGVEIHAAPDEHADVACRHVVGIGEEEDLLYREFPGSEEAEGPGDDEEHRETDGSGPWGGVRHGRILACRFHMTL